jgi:hypothetical protein
LGDSTTNLNESFLNPKEVALDLNQNELHLGNSTTNLNNDLNPNEVALDLNQNELHLGDSTTNLNESVLNPKEVAHDLNQNELHLGNSTTNLNESVLNPKEVALDLNQNELHLGDNTTNLNESVLNQNEGAIDLNARRLNRIFGDTQHELNRIQCDNQFGVTQSEIINLYTQTMKDIVTIEHLATELPLGHDKRAPFSSSRDRDICADPPLVGGSVQDLAGQANAESTDMRLAVNRTNENGITLLFEQYTQNELRDLLQKIIDGENADLIDMETHHSNASDIILMLRDSSQLENIDKHDQDQRLAIDEQSSYDHEMNQMNDDIQYEENAVTDRIIEAFGGLNHRGVRCYIS